MNLIEQLGGYENARAMRDSNIDSFDGDASGVRIHYMGDCFYQEDLDLSLLKYRRQHNIYEVGDKVVIRKADGHPDLFTYESISKSGNMHFFESPFNYGHLDLCKVRHATDKEIEAGKRLEVG